MNMLKRKPQAARIATARKGVILAGNVCIGYQISSLLDHYDWKTNVVHKEHDLYDFLKQRSMDVVIIDIINDRLAGLSALEHCHKHYPSITTYAIAQYDDRYKKILARDVGGCQGFFYLTNSNLKVDTNYGLAAEFSNRHIEENYDSLRYSSMKKFADKHI